MKKSSKDNAGDLESMDFDAVQQRGVNEMLRENLARKKRREVEKPQPKANRKGLNRGKK